MSSDTPGLRRRLSDRLQSPPPWFWGGNRHAWRRLGCGPVHRLPLELLQQLHWWFIRPLSRQPSSPADPVLPSRLTWRACWLNSYGPAEVGLWLKVGVEGWRQLRRHCPENLVWAVHAARRRAWPEQCRPALALLSDKCALLALAPRCWQPPFLSLPDAAGSDPTPAPDWWTVALKGPGLVLKPRWGHGGRAVIRFRWSQGSLHQQALFRRLPGDSPLWHGAMAPEPAQLLAHWQQLCRCRDAAVASTYLSHSAALPAAEPSVVVRVITGRDRPQGPVRVLLAWLEVPLGEGPVALIRSDGHTLPLPAPPLTPSQNHSLHDWQAQLLGGFPAPIAACLAAATAMHQRLPPIDQVAWDWIPAGSAPQLLEGNGCFGLLVPQLFGLRLPAELWEDA